MQGIRKKQRLLVELLTTKAYKTKSFRPSTQKLMIDTLDFCAKYERAKRPFNHEVNRNGNPASKV